MTLVPRVHPLSPKELGDYGFARVRDITFDAVQTLWRRRRSEGMRQTDVVKAIERNPAWVSRNLRAPGNWTLRTIGELVEALNGELEIIVHAKEDLPEPKVKRWVIRRGDQYYSGYTPDMWCDDSRSAFRFCIEDAAYRQASELLGLGYNTVEEYEP